jgi:hypothetical protein
VLCGPIHLCVCVSEKFGDEEGVGCDNVERERGVGVDVNDTMLFETLQLVRIVGAARMEIRFRKKNMNLCTCDSEECEWGGYRCE